MRKTTSKIIALLLVALTVFGMASTAGAVEFEGETSDGSWGSGGGTGGEDVDHKYTYFEVLSTTASQNIVAYRFSYVTLEVWRQWAKCQPGCKITASIFKPILIN